jgi:hypothetical protein
MTTLHGAGLASHLKRLERLQQVSEDYEWLIATGETHSETLAKRLFFPSVSTFERYLWRNHIPVRHTCLHGVHKKAA